MIGQDQANGDAGIGEMLGRENRELRNTAQHIMYPQQDTEMLQPSRSSGQETPQQMIKSTKAGECWNTNKGAQHRGSAHFHFNSFDFINDLDHLKSFFNHCSFGSYLNESNGTDLLLRQWQLEEPSGTPVQEKTISHMN